MKSAPNSSAKSYALARICCPSCGTPLCCSSRSVIESGPCPGCGTKLILTVSVHVESDEAKSFRLEAGLSEGRAWVGRSFASRSPKLRVVQEAALEEVSVDLAPGATEKAGGEAKEERAMAGRLSESSFQRELGVVDPEASKRRMERYGRWLGSQGTEGVKGSLPPMPQKKGPSE
jgi:hypothetical protein